MSMSAEEFKKRFKEGMLRKHDSDKCCQCGGDIEEHPDERHYTLGFESKGVIRIVKVPDGEAPLEVREKWVGVEIPTVFFESETTDGKGVVSGESKPAFNNYIVLQRLAIEALVKKSSEAAGWWCEHYFPKGENYFVFSADDVVEVEPVSPRLR